MYWRNGTAFKQNAKVLSAIADVIPRNFGYEKLNTSPFRSVASPTTEVWKAEEDNAVSDPTGCPVPGHDEAELAE